MGTTLATIKAITAIFNAGTECITAAGAFGLKLIGAASVLAAALPPPEGKSRLAHLHRIINWFGFNFGNAANKNTGA